MPFFVNKHTLIPRFDTEVLVESVIKHTKEGESILDMCTGSGCIAVVLAKHGYAVTASDVSLRALNIAKKNAALNDVKVDFVKSNLFEKFYGKTFDAIVCNPPYIKTAEIGKHDKSVLHEPAKALDGGADGLDFYRKIGGQAALHLNDGGQIFLEISSEQLEDVKTILQSGGFCDIKVIKDARGLLRVINARKNKGIKERI